MRLVKEEKAPLVKRVNCLSKKAIVCAAVVVLLILVGAGVVGAVIGVKMHSDKITKSLTELFKVRYLSLMVLSINKCRFRATQYYPVLTKTRRARQNHLKMQLMSVLRQKQAQHWPQSQFQTVLSHITQRRKALF